MKKTRLGELRIKSGGKNIKIETVYVLMNKCFTKPKGSVKPIGCIL